MRKDIQDFLWKKTEEISEALKRAIEKRDREFLEITVSLLSSISFILGRKQTEEQEEIEGPEHTESEHKEDQEPIIRKPVARSRIKPKRKKRSLTRKQGKSKEFNDNQLLVLSAVFHLDERNCQSVVEIVNALWPHEVSDPKRIFSSAAYARVRSSIDWGLKKIKDVMEGKTKVDSLPERDRKFFARLKEQHPTADFNDLVAMAKSITGKGWQKRKDKPKSPVLQERPSREGPPKGGPTPIETITQLRRDSGEPDKPIKGPVAQQSNNRCIDCDAVLTTLNPYDLCYPCQERLKEEGELDLTKHIRQAR